LRGKSNDSKVAKSGGRRPLRLLMVSLLFLLLLPLLLLLILHLPFVQRQVIAHVVQRLEYNTGVQIHVESYIWQPFNHLKLVDLRVESSGKEVMKCDKVQLDYRLSLNWPYLYPEELYLERPSIHLEKDDKGTYRLFRLDAKRAKKETSFGGPSFWVRYPWPPVRIVSGDIGAEQDGKQILSLRNVSGTFSFNVVQGPNGPRLKIDIGRWQSHLAAPRWEKMEKSSSDISKPKRQSRIAILLTSKMTG
jgi:hypothetical protein